MSYAELSKRLDQLAKHVRVAGFSQDADALANAASGEVGKLLGDFTLTCRHFDLLIYEDDVERIKSGDTRKAPLYASHHRFPKRRGLSLEENDRRGKLKRATLLIHDVLTRRVTEGEAADKLDLLAAAMRELAAAETTIAGALYDLQPGRMLVRGDREVKLSDDQCKLLRLLLSRNPLPLEATHAKDLNAPWHGIYKPSHFGKVQKAVNRLSSDRLIHVGLEAKLVDGAISIYSTDPVPI